MCAVWHKAWGTMSSAAQYRKQAEALYQCAREAADDSEALAYTLRGIELEMKADALECGQVQEPAEIKADALECGQVQEPAEIKADALEGGQVKQPAEIKADALECGQVQQSAEMKTDALECGQVQQPAAEPPGQSGTARDT